MTKLASDSRYTGLRQHFFTNLANQQRARVFRLLGLPQDALRFAMLPTMQTKLFDELYRTCGAAEIGDAMIAAVIDSQPATAARRA